MGLIAFQGLDDRARAERPLAGAGLDQAPQRRAEAKLDEVRDKIERLEGIGTALERLIRACPGKGALGACSIIEALVGAAGKTGGHPNSVGKENPT